MNVETFENAFKGVNVRRRVFTLEDSGKHCTSLTTIYSHYLYSLLDLFAEN